MPGSLLAGVDGLLGIHNAQSGRRYVQYILFDKGVMSGIYQEPLLIIKDKVDTAP